MPGFYPELGSMLKILATVTILVLAVEVLTYS